MGVHRSSRSTLAGVFVLALSIIVFEIALTRVFAIMMWHHFTYMVISVGLLGFGAAGSILTARQDALRSDSPVPQLCTCSLAYGVSVVAAFAFATRIEIDSLRIWEDPTNLLRFGVLYAAIAVPFVFGGMAIGMALTRFARDVNRLYFSDLLGSALGAGVSILLLSQLGGSTSVVFASLGGLLAAFLFALEAGPRHRLLAGGGVAAGVLLFAASAGLLSPLSIGPIDWPIPWAPGKEMREIDDPRDVHRLFSATAEVEVAPSEQRAPTMGGDISYRAQAPLEARLVGQDGTAPTILYRGAADLARFGFLRHAQAASAYLAHAARGGVEPAVMVIGVGGGVDVMLALEHGARRVTAVELNTAMVEMVRGAYDEYLGGLFRPGAHPFSDRIRLVNGEGRSRLRNGRETYDIIQMSGVDSFTALNSGAYALSESYLYTVEAGEGVLRTPRAGRLHQLLALDADAPEEAARDAAPGEHRRDCAARARRGGSGRTDRRLRRHQLGVHHDQARSLHRAGDRGARELRAGAGLRGHGLRPAAPGGCALRHRRPGGAGAAPGPARHPREPLPGPLRRARGRAHRRRAGRRAGRPSLGRRSGFRARPRRGRRRHPRGGAGPPELRSAHLRRLPGDPRRDHGLRRGDPPRLRHPAARRRAGPRGLRGPLRVRRHALDRRQPLLLQLLPLVRAAARLRGGRGGGGHLHAPTSRWATWCCWPRWRRSCCWPSA